MNLRGVLAPLTLSFGAVVAFLLAAETVTRLARVGVGTVQINRGVVRMSADPKLGFELRPKSSISGVPGYNLDQEVENLRARLEPLKPFVPRRPSGCRPSQPDGTSHRRARRCARVAAAGVSGRAVASRPAAILRKLPSR